MPYDIKIKGLKDLVREEDHLKAFSIKKSWEQFKLGKANNSLTKIGTWEGALSDIGYFNEISAVKKNDHVVIDSQKEFLQARREFLSKGIEYRSNHLDFFRFIYWGFTKKKSEEVMIGDKPLEEYAKNIQRKFFHENPNRACCEPALFRPLIKASKCHMTVLSIIENQI